MNHNASDYRGRFAPSPTGPLHLGSLLAAAGSWLDARSRGGAWLLRMEDVDQPRVARGAADDILRTLEAFGLYWDGEVMYQSRRGDAYRAALESLRGLDMVYPCNCSRREIADSALSRDGGLIYPGHCRNGMKQARPEHAIRVRAEGAPICFRDRLQGEHAQHLATEVGDFVLRRADGLYAYQLAVVVDDAAQGITDVVRGADILDSTPRQIYLQRLLGLPTPAYLHLPVMLNERGEKLSKQTLAPSVSGYGPRMLLPEILSLLGQAPPAALAGESLPAIWDWALRHWDAARIPPRRTIAAASMLI